MHLIKNYKTFSNVLKLSYNKTLLIKKKKTLLTKHNVHFLWGNFYVVTSLQSALCMPFSFGYVTTQGRLQVASTPPRGIINVPVGTSWSQYNVLLELLVIPHFWLRVTIILFLTTQRRPKSHICKCPSQCCN